MKCKERGVSVPGLEFFFPLVKGLRKQPKEWSSMGWPWGAVCCPVWPEIQRAAHLYGSALENKVHWTKPEALQTHCPILLQGFMGWDLSLQKKNLNDSKAWSEIKFIILKLGLFALKLCFLSARKFDCTFIEFKAKKLNFPSAWHNHSIIYVCAINHRFTEIFFASTKTPLRPPHLSEERWESAVSRMFEDQVLSNQTLFMPRWTETKLRTWIWIVQTAIEFFYFWIQGL